MIQDIVSIVSYITETILAAASLIVSVIALIISLNTYRQTRKPVIGMYLFKENGYIRLSLQNHGNGDAQNVRVACHINNRETSNSISFIPPNTAISISLIPTSAWEQLHMQEQHIICSYSYVDCFGHRQTYRNIELLFQ